MPQIYDLTNRSVFAISGEDAAHFLQGLISNDIRKASADTMIYTLMLTPQGKFLYDFFIIEKEGKYLLDCNAAKIAEIQKKLGMYKLRSKVVIEDVSGQYHVVAASEKMEGSYADPRSSALPFRSITQSSPQGGTWQDYEKIRIKLGIPADIDMEDSFPLEYEMDSYNAIDYKKGCYVGQELTARTHYRGTVRKKPYVIKAAEGVDLSAYMDAEITGGTGLKVGKMRSSIGNIGLALLRVEDLEKSASISVAGQGIEVVKK